ncbi:MAG: alpha/beta hydrolase [Sinobacteraceae bacterium]|nr:alpha/beta hydrolase [Nevskiaceae bacterium]
MDRRSFLHTALALPAAMAVAAAAADQLRPPGQIDVRQFHAMRRFIQLPMGRIAYIERGQGPAALFLHGLPLNSYQWRGALERLSEHRRCLAPDFLGLGYTEAAAGTDQRPEAQVVMLATFLDTLGEHRVDLIASDSGGAVAQLFTARHPSRVRTLILTNCDAGADCPPQVLLPLIPDAHAGTATDKMIGGWLRDRERARSLDGLGVAYTAPGFLTDELLDVYLKPLVQSPLRKEQFNRALIALENNFLLPIEAELKRFQRPVRIIWGTADTLFKPESPEYLTRLFPGSRGVRRVEGGRLFWPEEFPDILAEEARKLWGV